MSLLDFLFDTAIQGFRWLNLVDRSKTSKKNNFSKFPLHIFRSDLDYHLMSRLTDTTIQNLWEVHEEAAQQTPNKTVEEAYNEMNRDVRKVLEGAK